MREDLSGARQNERSLVGCSARESLFDYAYCTVLLVLHDSIDHRQVVLVVTAATPRAKLLP